MNVAMACSITATPSNRHCETCSAFASFGPRESNVVIEEELVRVRAKPDLVDFARALVTEIGLNHVLGEDIPLQEELVIALKGVERLVERSGRLRNLCHFLGRQVVEVLVDRI